MLNVSHRQLRAFLLVAQLRNFSRAAEQLYIAQSGLSLMVRELEEQLGFRLFNRTTRQVMLTELGEKFLPIAQRNVHSLEAAAAELGQSARVSRQSLSVAAPPMTSANLLPRVVAGFRRLHPEVRLQVIDTDLGGVSKLVRDGSVDLGLGMFVKAAPGVVRTPLFGFLLAHVQAHRSFRWSEEPVHWKDLREQPLVALPADNPLQQLIDRHLRQAGRRDEPAYTVNFIDTQLGLVAAGCAEAIVPTTVLAHGRHRKLLIRPIDGPGVALEFYEVRDRSRRLPDCAADFTELLRQQAQRTVLTRNSDAMA